MHYESTEFEDVSDADFRSLKELANKKQSFSWNCVVHEDASEEAVTVNVVDNVPASVIVQQTNGNTTESNSTHFFLCICIFSEQKE